MKKAIAFFLMTMIFTIAISVVDTRSKEFDVDEWYALNWQPEK